ERVVESRVQDGGDPVGAAPPSAILLPGVTLLLVTHRRRYPRNEGQPVLKLLGGQRCHLEVAKRLADVERVEALDGGCALALVAEPLDVTRHRLLDRDESGRLDAGAAEIDGDLPRLIVGEDGGSIGLSRVVGPADRAVAVLATNAKAKDPPAGPV